MAAEESGLSATLDKVLFVSKVPLLLKATAADETPTPGYMYQEINELSLVSSSYCQTLLDYLIDRLDKDSCYVKLKVLKILQYVVENGHPHFREGLRRNSRGIKEATKYAGPLDPLNGNTPYLNVRKAAQDLSQVLFDVNSGDTEMPQKQPHTKLKSTGGMGNMTSSNASHGFGSVQNRPTKSLGETIVSGLRELADRVVEPQDPRWVAEKETLDQFKGGAYKPVQLTMHSSAGGGTADWEKPPTGPQPQLQVKSLETHRSIVAHRPGVAGGGWDEDVDYLERPLQAQTSSSTLVLSGGGSTSSRHSDSMEDQPNSSGTEVIDRLSNMQIDSWNAEEELVTVFVENQQRTLPSRNDINSFIKRCGELNCEKVVSLLNSHLRPHQEPKAMRILMILDHLMRTDLVTVDYIAQVCAIKLVTIYKAAHGQAKAKARKVIRQLQLLSNQVELFHGMPPMARDMNKGCMTLPPDGDTTSIITTKDLNVNLDNITPQAQSSLNITPREATPNTSAENSTTAADPHSAQPLHCIEPIYNDKKDVNVATCDANRRHSDGAIGFHECTATASSKTGSQKHIAHTTHSYSVNDEPSMFDFLNQSSHNKLSPQN